MWNVLQNTISQSTFRSSRPEVFCKKGVHRNFAKFQRKHLCQSLFLNKVAGSGLRPATFLKKRLWHSCFPVNFANIRIKPFFIEHLWWLLLYLQVELQPELIGSSAGNSQIFQLNLQCLMLGFHWQIYSTFSLTLILLTQKILL